jgi:hypothetical protein
MNDWRLAVGKLNEIVKSTTAITSPGEKAGLYAAARVLLADLEEAVKKDGGNTYALEKIGNAKWHIGAPDVLQNLFCGRLARSGSVSSSLLAATMNQKSSLRKVPQFVSGVLTANNNSDPLSEFR